ncbi:MAG: hypothetical protein QXZ68_07950 [Candidatus Bathyarchaeia archaeon]
MAENGEPHGGSIHFQGDLGNDYHSLFDVCNEKASDIGKWIEIEFTTRPYTSQALSHWGIEYAILRNVDVYIETLGGAGCLEVDYICIEVYSESQPPEILPYALALVIMVALSIFAFTLTKRRTKTTVNF